MINKSPAMLGILADVRRFHEEHGTTDALTPTADPSPELVRLRVKLIMEEMMETVSAMIQIPVSPAGLKADIAEACEVFDDLPIAYNMDAVADGLADLIYVCAGAALALGFQDRFASVWTEVQRANMAKLGGPRREDGKILKPEGWQPPDIAGALSD